jgi:Kdo2-lipid IVA lauroyltransferase/acyltransferase
MKEWFEYAAYRIMVFKFAVTPFRLLYILSDVLSFLLQYILRYRRKVIDNNLRNSFPEKTQHELKSIRKKFYRTLTDMIVETMKAFSCPKEKIISRMKSMNPEILDTYYKEGRSCILLMSHYSNWEWVPYTTQLVDHVCCALYKPVRNKLINSHLLKRRGRAGLLLYSQKQTGIMIRDNMHKPALFTYITDQNPGGDVEDEFWVDFLHQKTAVIGGADALARKFNLPVFYYQVKRVSRGRYEAYFVPVELHPDRAKKGDISKAYMKILEENIRKKPEEWLWSHRRWKKTPPPHILQS